MTETKKTASARTPLVGDLVLVPENADHNNGAKVAPAVVTAVLSETAVNVRVWADNSDNPEWRTSLNQVASLEDFDIPDEDGKISLHKWCWR